MKGDQINLWYRYQCLKASSKNFFAIDTLFSAAHYRQNKTKIIRATNFVNGGDIPEDYEGFLLPIIEYDTPSHKNVKKIDQKIGHWCTGIYLKSTNTLHYFDPIGSTQVLPHVREIIINCVKTLAIEETSNEPEIVIHSDSFNRQGINDTSNCGFYCCHIVKRFLESGIDNLMDTEFVLNDFKLHVATTIAALIPAEEIPLDTEIMPDEIEVLSANGQHNNEPPFESLQLPCDIIKDEANE
uniref:Ubiquitin-like protease family profile domain-containing protein n=1 Tax=Panagrolaimus superbus TaxID=310955 RepID=A0A914XTL7_9BILA